MPAKSVRLRPFDILDAIEGIRGVVADLDFRRATERGLEIISEASRHIPAI